MYNRIHNDYDTNVVRVELNSSYRPRQHSITPRNRVSSREPTKITSSSAINRHDTFTKHDNNDRPTSTGIIRSETFIVKHHSREDLSDRRHEEEAGDYSTYTKSKKKQHNGKYDGDKTNNFYDTYTRRGSSRSEMRGSIDDEKSLYINTDTYRKLDKKRASLLSQESENLNANTFTKTSKPKRVESFIRKIEKNLWRRKDTKKEPSPAPSSHSSDQSTIKRSKNIFNLISGGRKSTREVEIQCKMDEEKDYYGGIGTRKSSNGNEKKFSITRPLRAFQQKNYENGSNQRLTSIMKSSPQQQQQPDHRLREYESNKKSSTPAPIRIEIDLRNTNKRPIGVASPLPQKTRSALKNGNNIKSKSGNYDSGYKKPPEIIRSHAPSRLQVNADNGNDLRRDGNERVSFREYREQLRAAKTENRQKITDTSDDDLRRSYQQSFFVPM